MRDFKFTVAIQWLSDWLFDSKVKRVIFAPATNYKEANDELQQIKTEVEKEQTYG